MRFVQESLQRISSFASLECRDVFNQVKEKLSQELKNYYLSMVYQLAYKQLDTFLQENLAEKSVLNELLAEFEYEQFKEMQ